MEVQRSLEQEKTSGKDEEDALRTAPDIISFYPSWNQMVAPHIETSEVENQVKLYRFWKVSRQLQRERGDGRALTRCISELRMKGASFDLSKEPQIGKKMKSSSVEIKWKPLTWLSQKNVVWFADIQVVELVDKRKGDI
ncbi:hypothetical protein K7X08_012399 [Anisodus acutangulus]|uniref:Uncharacterized protein n=1 Tax=Anisodus acutangulus TaxID=402998 RepID=A0A9Q1QX19_9SOLA|nr:hypothetical protein K7X08_012399 [Anisodus acutangulus]